jgi:hypothetical protein
MKAVELKGVYNLNPTRMIFKLGSEDARRATTQARPAGRVNKRAATKQGKTK